MNSKERVSRAIHFRNPDRVPISHAVLPAAQIKYGDALSEILEEVDEDFGWNQLKDLERSNYPAQYKKGKDYDGFHTLWYCEQEGICGIPIEYPINSYEKMDGYQWPVFSVTPPKTRLYSGHVSGSKAYYSRGAWITFFEQLQQLRGFNETMMDLMVAPDELFELRDKLLEWSLNYLDQWLEYDYDGIHFADDWGTQLNLMIPPETWRSFFKPVYKQLFDKVISAGMDVHFHSDGFINEIIPDLIDMGVKVINCQVNLIGLEYVKKNFRGKVCFRTDLDRQHVLPFGTPKEVEMHIHEVFEHLGTPDGGIIACGEIGPDIPLENIRAMYKTFLIYKY